MTTDLPEPPAFDPDLIFDHDDTIVATISALIDPEEYMTPSLWFVLVHDTGHPLPVIVPIDELPDSPDPETSIRIFEALGDVLSEHAPGGTVVGTLVHPDGGVVSDHERRWYGHLHAAAHHAGVNIRALLTAGRRGTSIIRLDDVGMSA